MALLIGSAAVLIHIEACRRAIPKIRSAEVFGLTGSGWRRQINTSVACTMVGNLLWSAGTLMRGHLVPGVGGFLPGMSPVWYLGLLLLIAAVVLAREKTEAYSAVALGSLVGALTLTPAFLYGMPRSQSAAKHVDLVKQILQSHYLSPSANIYEAYSGLFNAAAWLCDVANVGSSLGLATFWPLVIGLLALVELRFFFGQVLRFRSRMWVGATFAVLVNAIGADYFSPQSVGFVLALGVYALTLGHVWPGITGRLRISLLCLAGCSLAVTHELSPYIAGGVLAILVLFRAARPWYAPAICILPSVLWAVINRSVVGGFLNFGDLGNLANFAPPQTTASTGLHRLAMVGYSSRALLLGLLFLIVLAGFGFLRMARRVETWGFLASAGVGLCVISVNPYGNEGIFRAALFAIPWLAVLATAAVRRHPPVWISLSYPVSLVFLLSTFLLAMFGLDNATVIRASTLQVLRVYQSDAEESSYLLNLSYGNLPASVTFPQQGHVLRWRAVAAVAQARLQKPDVRDASQLAHRYIEYAARTNSAQPRELYALWSSESVNYAVDYGLESLSQARGWRRALAASRSWKLVYKTGGTFLFRVVIPQARDGQHA
jgi:hypothetical protein